jgi:hypothetical protein
MDIGFAKLQRKNISFRSYLYQLCWLKMKNNQYFLSVQMSGNHICYHINGSFAPKILQIFWRDILSVPKICLPLHRKRKTAVAQRENSSVGRARPCQGRGRGFESRFSLQERTMKYWQWITEILIRENSSVGRARPCQGRGRGFESRFSLQALLDFSDFTA